MENYKNMKGENQSSLKKILLHPSEYLKAKEQQEQPDSEEPHFLLGSLVDTGMYDSDKLKDKYLITDLPSLSDSMLPISSTIIDRLELEEISTFGPSEKIDKIVLEVCELHNYGSKWKPETKLKKVYEACTDYINIKLQSKGKTLISSEINYKMLNCLAALRSDFRTRKYFLNDFEEEFVVDKTKDLQMFKHLKLQFEYDGVLLKCELDQLVINHKKKEIIPIDLKTLGRKIYSFSSQFWKFRYDFQAATYKEALLRNAEIQKLLDSGYTLHNFRFIVVESDVTNKPMVYEVSSEALEIGFQGGTTSKGYKYEGLIQAIERLKHHKEKDQWDYPMEYESNNIMIEV